MAGTAVSLVLLIPTILAQNIVAGVLADTCTSPILGPMILLFRIFGEIHLWPPVADGEIKLNNKNII